jgi:hypothetical protein
MRITEINFHIRGHREGFVFGHLQSSVPGQRAPQCRWQLTNLPGKGGDDGRRIFAGHLDERGKTRMTFHQGSDVTVPGAAKQIALPMTGNGANVDFPQRSIFNTFGKTPAATRKLTMTDDIYAILKNRSENTESRYAFPSPDYPDRSIGRVHKAHDGAVIRAGIKPRFILYDLRHTYASRADMAGVDLQRLSDFARPTSLTSARPTAKNFPQSAASMAILAVTESAS